MGDIYYGAEELKRIVGNNCCKIANDFDVLADMVDNETDEIFFQNMAGFLRQTAEDHLFSKPIKHEGDNVIDFHEYANRRG
jgi:hypothetical protein